MQATPPTHLDIYNHSALNLDRILEYVGLPTRAEKHNALHDAKLEAEAFSRLFQNKGLLSEYATYPIPELYDNRA